MVPGYAMSHTPTNQPNRRQMITIQFKRKKKTTYARTSPAHMLCLFVCLSAHPASRRPARGHRTAVLALRSLLRKVPDRYSSCHALGGVASRV